MPRLFADELDRRLVKEIISPGSARWDVREPYSSIAKRLAVDEETVRRRIARLRKDGVIGKFELVLNPRLIDRENAILYLESKDHSSIARAISKLRLVDGIISLTSLHEGGLLVSMYYQTEGSLARQIALIESICDAKTAMSWTAPYPRFAGAMTKTDWIIVQELRKDPRERLSNIARGLEVSPRTINRRIKRLNDGNAFFLFLEFNFTRIEGLHYLLLVHCEDRKKKREVDKMISSGLKRLVYGETWATNHSLYAFECENILDAERTYRRIKKIDGVSDMKLGIIRDRIHNMGWVDEEIERRIASF